MRTCLNEDEGYQTCAWIAPASLVLLIGVSLAFFHTGQIGFLIGMVAFLLSWIFSYIKMYLMEREYDELLSRGFNDNEIKIMMNM